MKTINAQIKEEIREEILENIKDYADAGETKAVGRFERQLMVLENIGKCNIKNIDDFFPRIDDGDFDSWSTVIKGIAGGWYISGCGRRDLPNGFTDFLS